MKHVYKFLAGGIGIGVLVASFLMVFFRTFDPQTRVVYDGLGRVLTEPPLWAKVFLTEEAAWAGLGWHLLDIVWFFGGIGLAIFLFNLGDD